MVKNNLSFSSKKHQSNIVGFLSFKDKSLLAELEEFIESLKAIGYLDNEGATLSDKGLIELINGCKALVKIEPDFLPAYFHAAKALFKSMSFVQSKQWCETALGVAYNVMPKNFEGELNWQDTDNKQFLKIHYLYVFCLKRLNEIDLFNHEKTKHLRWNNDQAVAISFKLKNEPC